MEEINLCGRPNRCCPVLKMDRETNKFKVYDAKPENGKPYDTDWQSKEEILKLVKEDRLPLTFRERTILIQALG